MSDTNDRPPTYGRILDWWTSELARVGQSGQARGQQWRLMVMASRDEVVFCERRGSAATEVMRWPATAPPGSDRASQKSLRNALRKANARPEQIILRLDPGDVVLTRVRYPLALRADLGKVIGNRLDTLAPWPGEQAIFDHVEAGVADGTLQVDVMIADGAYVRHLLGQLKGLGIEPGVVDAGEDADAPTRFNLLQTRDSDGIGRQRRAARLLATLGIATLVATGAAMAWEYRLANLNAELGKSIQTQVASLRPRTDANGNDPRQLTARVLEMRRAAPSVTVAIEALARRLPEDVVLDRIDVREGVLTLTGKATAPHTLVALIEGLPHFKDAQFVAATTKAPGDAKSAFSIATRLQTVSGAQLP